MDYLQPFVQTDKAQSRTSRTIENHFSIDCLTIPSTFISPGTEGMIDGRGGQREPYGGSPEEAAPPRGAGRTLTTTSRFRLATLAALLSPRLPETNDRCAAMVAYDDSNALKTKSACRCAARECGEFPAAIEGAGQSSDAIQRHGRRTLSGTWRGRRKSAHQPGQVEINEAQQRAFVEAPGRCVLPAPLPSLWRMRRDEGCVRAHRGDEHMALLADAARRRRALQQRRVCRGATARAPSSRKVSAFGSSTLGASLCARTGQDEDAPVPRFVSLSGDRPGDPGGAFQGAGEVLLHPPPALPLPRPICCCALQQWRRHRRQFRSALRQEPPGARA